MLDNVLKQGEVGSQEQIENFAFQENGKYADAMDDQHGNYDLENDKSCILGSH